MAAPPDSRTLRWSGWAFASTGRPITRYSTSFVGMPTNSSGLLAGNGDRQTGACQKRWIVWAREISSGAPRSAGRSWPSAVSFAEGLPEPRQRGLPEMLTLPGLEPIAIAPAPRFVGILRTGA